MCTYRRFLYECNHSALRDNLPLRRCPKASQTIDVLASAAVNSHEVVPPMSAKLSYSASSPASENICCNVTYHPLWTIRISAPCSVCRCRDTDTKALLRRARSSIGDLKRTLVRASGKDGDIAKELGIQQDNHSDGNAEEHDEETVRKDREMAKELMEVSVQINGALAATACLKKMRNGGAGLSLEQVDGRANENEGEETNEHRAENTEEMETELREAQMQMDGAIAAAEFLERRRRAADAELFM